MNEKTSDSKENNEPIVYIRRQWNDWRIAQIPLRNLTNLHWDNFSGGVFAKAPQFFIHGYAWCTNIEGDIAHSCMHGHPPHSIKVCVVKKDNDPTIFSLLLDVVGPKAIYKATRRE